MRLAGKDDNDEEWVCRALARVAKVLWEQQRSTSNTNRDQGMAAVREQQWLTHFNIECQRLR